MVQLILSNKNPSSAHQRVRINLNKGLCRFEDKQTLSLKELRSQKDFIHPLLSEPCSHPSLGPYLYEYNTVEELFYAGIFVYTALLQAENPAACIFKIKPSALFKWAPYPTEILFSTHKDKKAQEWIPIKQLESLVSDLLGLKFTYSEDVVIDDEFSLQDLPRSVDGDALYEPNQAIVDLLIKPRNFDYYEIRYISPEMGLGVFSRKAIPEGSFISFYTGVKKKYLQDGLLNFSFMPIKDCLRMAVDACQFGNIARFCNHAPKSFALGKKSLLLANLKCSIYRVRGIELFIYIANKDILPGEQLLVDYGKRYFIQKEMYGFLDNGKIVSLNKKQSHFKIPQRVKSLRKMATHGIKKAQKYLFLRTLFLCLLFIIILESFALLWHS